MAGDFAIPPEGGPHPYVSPFLGETGRFDLDVRPQRGIMPQKEINSLV